MRKKRAWSTREDNAESEETAAFEAAVAAAKDTATKSDAFLSTAKSDLTDHQRWLKAQSAAVDRDRARHERWLERQRDHRVAAARKDRTRRRRQLMRQRASVAIQQAAGASGLFVGSLFLLVIAKTVAGVKYVGVLIARGVTFVGRSLRDATLYVAHLIAAGARWTAATLKAVALAIGRTILAGLAWSGAKAQASARVGGAALATGSAVVAAKAQESARVGGAALATGSSLVASKTGVVSRSAGRSLGTGFSAASAKGGRLADAAGRSTSRGFAVVSGKASVLVAASKRRLSAGYAWSKTRALAVAPALYVGIAKFGRQAERSARAGAARARGGFEKTSAPVPEFSGAAIEVYGPRADGVDVDDFPANDARALSAGPPAIGPEIYGPFHEGFWVDGVSPNDPQALEPRSRALGIVALRVGAKNALSSWAQGLQAQGARVRGAWAQNAFAQNLWARTRDVDLSQMMIIAGAVLLVCGGLLLGGGLILRTGAGAGTVTPQASEEPLDGIAWTFEELDRPLPDRAVFTLSGTPESFRINGLSISGTNQSDQPLTAVHAILKPDVQRPELKLILQVDRPAVPTNEADSGGQALDIVAANTVPPHAPFRLVFPFPPEAMDGEDGITVDEFFESYGGLLLKFRYEIDDKQKSLIQYLPPELLHSQLDEVVAAASGS